MQHGVCATFLARRTPRGKRNLGTKPVQGFTIRHLSHNRPFEEVETGKKRSRWRGPRRTRTVFGSVLGPWHDASCRTCVAPEGRGCSGFRRDSPTGRSDAPPPGSANAARVWRGRSRAGDGEGRPPARGGRAGRCGGGRHRSGVPARGAVRLRAVGGRDRRARDIARAAEAPSPDDGPPSAEWPLRRAPDECERTVPPRLKPSTRKAAPASRRCDAGTPRR